MTNVVQVYDYRFPNMQLPIMQLQIRVSEIAQSLGVEVECWEEDGLGQAQGMLLRLPSGRVVLLREFQHLIEHHRTTGPAVEIDAAAIAEFGVDHLIGEVLTSLGLSQQSVDWRASSEHQRQLAADLVRQAEDYKKRRK